MLKSGMNRHNILAQMSGTPPGFENHAAKYYNNFKMQMAMQNLLPPEYYEVPKPEQSGTLLNLIKQYRGGRQWQ